MKNFQKYYNWLLIDSIIVILVGVYVTYFNSTQSFIFNRCINPAFWPDGMISNNETIRFIRFIYCLFGAVMIIWGILLWFILRNGFNAKQKWAWQSIFVSIIIWFPVDESFSIYYGVTFNALFNLFFLFTFLLPLLLSRKHFH